MGGRLPRVLTIAGSDSSGGAGIQADIKTITAHGAYAASAITAITAQNTKGVSDVLALDPGLVKSQINAVLEDIGVDAIKIGMLANAGVIKAVAETLPDDIPVVLDPVMVATSGDALLDDGAKAALMLDLIPRADLLTPNIPEAEALTSIKGDLDKAGAALLAMGAKAVLIKGGHGEADEILDLLYTAEGVHLFSHKRIKTHHTHGTGCTLSAAIACNLASGLPLKKAVEMGIDYVLKALSSAPGLGSGNGPLGHALGMRIYDKK